MKNTTTHHAKVRMQQRAIPPFVVDLLLNYGTEEQAHRGATRYFFDKRSVKRAKAYLGQYLARYVDEYRNCAVVLSDTGVVITALHRFH